MLLRWDHLFLIQDSPPLSQPYPSNILVKIRLEINTLDSFLAKYPKNLICWLKLSIMTLLLTKHSNLEEKTHANY